MILIESTRKCDPSGMPQLDILQTQVARLTLKLTASQVSRWGNTIFKTSHCRLGGLLINALEDWDPMNHLMETRPQRLESENLIFEQLPDELMIFDPDRNKAFCLNQTASFVWRHCDGTTTVSEMAELLRQDWGKPVDEQVIWFALDILSKDGLLAPCPALSTGVGVTRRELLQKLGTGAAMAVPLVTVLFVNPARAHASSLAPTSVQNSALSGAPSNGGGGFWEWLEKFF